MSTNQTENYGLHAWEREDRFLLTEINENFALIDEAVRMTVGAYTGNGGTTTVELGSRPRLVVVCSGANLGGISYLAIDGVAVRETPLTITDTGFLVRSSTGSSGNPNSNGGNYQYFAFY